MRETISFNLSLKMKLQNHLRASKRDPQKGAGKTLQTTEHEWIPCSWCFFPARQNTKKSTPIVIQNPPLELAISCYIATARSLYVYLKDSTGGLFPKWATQSIGHPVISTAGHTPNLQGKMTLQSRLNFSLSQISVFRYSWFRSFYI